MLKPLILSVVTLGISLAIYLYSYLGVRLPVTVAVEKLGPFELIYKTHVGPYHQIAPVIAEVERWAADHHLRCAQTFGEFLDNPESVDEDRLRSHAGCVLGSLPPKDLPPDLTYQHREERKFAVGHFAGSPAIGPYKVYPKVRRFLEDQRLKSSVPVIEMYEVRGTEVVTSYLFGLDPSTQP